MEPSPRLAGHQALPADRDLRTDGPGHRHRPRRPARTQQALELRLPERGALTVVADGRNLEQALVNLLHNALEATPEGGVVGWIARREGDGVAIGVADSGPGMPAEVLAVLGAAGATTKPHGSGIGLAVARAIAEQHGGRLTAHNLDASGCEVLLRLPAQPPEAEPPAHQETDR